MLLWRLKKKRIKHREKERVKYNQTERECINYNKEQDRHTRETLKE